MALFKKIAITRITKKRATQLWNGLVETLNAHPNMEPKEAIAKYIKDTIELGASFTLPHENYSLDSLYELLNKARKDKEMPWDGLFTLLTAKLVFEELSYDPSIGTQEDFRIVSNITSGLLTKWASFK